MDRLWTPWRYEYITDTNPDRRKGVPAVLRDWPVEDGLGCVFCNIIASVDWAIANGMPTLEAERAAHILRRDQYNYVCLNAFPYSTGHVLIVPYVHLDSLANLDPQAATEMMLTLQDIERALRTAYQPAGVNLGMNLGAAAGAGIADHLHMHALPRWLGDTNFMTVVGNTRVLPESLEVTWRKLRELVTLGNSQPHPSVRCVV